MLGPSDAQLFGIYHPADPAIARDVGAVLCNPIGYEAMCAHRAYRHLAERLATAGVHTLRFDYHGTGDSSGHGDDPGRVRAWLESVDAAVDGLLALSGARAVDLVGVRFGATLAALAAATRSDVRGLVLWAPCVSGRAYVRELRAFQRMTERTAGVAEPLPAQGDEEIAGHVFEPATLRDLSAIDLLEGRSPRVRRALVLPRDGLPGAEPRLVAHLASCGVDARLGEDAGYSQMMRDAQDTIVPWATIDSIARWITEPRDGASRAPAAARAGACVLTAWSQAGGLAVREEALRFGATGRLFGILTELASRPVVPDRPAIVLLNVGANHHVGPNRMYVSLARDLAARGYPCLRFDIAGLGESRLGVGTIEEALYSNDSLDDVDEALTLLTRMRGVRRVVLLGLCSGAYLAFHAAATDPRVAGQVLINPQTFAWKAGDSLALQARTTYKSTRHYMGALMSRRVWARAFRGQVDLRGVADALGERLAARVHDVRDRVAARLRRRPAPRSEIERTLFAVSDRGVESLLIFSAADGGLDMIERHLGPGARRARGRDNLRVEIIEGADHTFTRARSRHELQDLITRFVEAAFP